MNKKVEKALEAGKAYILANRHQTVMQKIANSPLPKKRYGKRMSKAEAFELRAFAANMHVQDTRNKFEDALSKLNKDEAHELTHALQEAKV